MQIRAPRDTDFAALAAITNHYIATTAIHFGYDAVSEAELRASWEHDRGRYPWLTAELDGVVLGYAKAGTWRARAAYQWTAETGIYIADAARGRGAGRALYTALLDELTRRGFHSAVAGVTLPNDASLRLHEAFGFRAVGVFADAGFKHGAWHSVAFFQKQLNAGAPGR